MHKRRVEQLIHRMNEKKIPALLVTNPVNRKYLTGFTGSAGTVLITPEHTVLLTDFRYTEQAAQQAQHAEVIGHGPDVKKEIRTKLDDWKIRSLAFEENHLTYHEYAAYSRSLEGIELLPTSGLVEDVRIRKDDFELKVMKEAAALADRAYEHILESVKPGVREREIALELEIFMRGQGAVSSSFDIIVASGERSALPHGVVGERVLQSGEFVKMDFGAYYKDYCSDITRTVMLGTPTDRHKEIYEIVLEAQMYALEHIRPGMTGREADALARDIIEKYGYGKQFGHSTGHGLGMEIHEAPRLSVKSDTILEPGMTVTVEPGIYLPGFGGVRIEDDIVITDKGAERLTLSDKSWLQI